VAAGFKERTILDAVGAQTAAFPRQPMNSAGAVVACGKYSDDDDSDEFLMAQFQLSGNDLLFSKLTKRNADKVFRTAYLLLKNQSDAEDAAQECFLRLVKAKQSYDPSKPFSNWLMTILRNICRNELRRRSRAAGIDVESVNLEARTGDPTLQVHNSESFEASARALGRLSEVEREIVNLRVHGKLEYAEIGALCKISAEAAKKRAYRAIEKLRRALSGKI
jgi:RNA polymerase sigma-70 factor (ECF subfamily)